MSPVTLDELATDPHPALASLRESSPVAWLDELGGWIVTSHELCSRVLIDSATFTVDDERFSTRRVVGPSMLSLDGPGHSRHRSAFAPEFRRRHVYQRTEDPIRELVRSLVDELAPSGESDLRAAVARPTATEVMRQVLGLGVVTTEQFTGWNDALISAIDAVTAHGSVPTYGTEAFAQLRNTVAMALHDEPLRRSAARSDLGLEEVAANVAVLLIGGIVTSDGAISIGLRHLLDRPALMTDIRENPALVDSFVEESMRLEPAAAFLDRYATRDVEVGSQKIRAGDLVRVSISAANRDPAVFDEPDNFDMWRESPGDHLTFARGPHACLGVHLAKLETRTVIDVLLATVPDLRAAPGIPPPTRGLIFRAPDRVPAVLAGDSATLS